MHIQHKFHILSQLRYKISDDTSEENLLKLKYF